MKTLEELFARLNQKVLDMDISVRLKNNCILIKAETIYDLLEKRHNNDPLFEKYVYQKSRDEIEDMLRTENIDIRNVKFDNNFKKAIELHKIILETPPSIKTLNNPYDFFIQKIADMNFSFLVLNNCKRLKVEYFFELLEKMKNNDPLIEEYFSPCSIDEIHKKLIEANIDIELVVFNQELIKKLKHYNIVSPKIRTGS